MDRRSFLKNSLMTWGAIALPTRGQKLRADASKSDGKFHIQYIREEIPSFDIPPYPGQTYEDKVPDTLDIAERARLGVHGLTSITDPEVDYEIHWLTQFFRNPPIMEHNFNDWVQNTEGLMEALPLLRTATGDSLNSQVDPVWMKATLKSIGPDRMAYVPLNGRPWGRLKVSGVDPVWRADGTSTNFKNPAVTQVTNPANCQRIIGTMTAYYLLDRNPMWKATIEKMIQRLSALAIDRGEYCYFPNGTVELNSKFDPGAEMPLGCLWGTTCNTRLNQGLGQ